MVRDRQVPPTKKQDKVLPGKELHVVVEHQPAPHSVVRSFFCATDRGVTKTQVGGKVGDQNVPFCPMCGFRMQENGVSRYAK